MKRFIISAPFGNYITHRKCTSICGTFTLHRRGNVLTRLYRVLKTIRPVKNGWVNSIGLQNSGIDSVTKFRREKIYSITAITQDEWDILASVVPSYVMVELNLSCPNIKEKLVISDHQVRAYLKKFPIVIFKLSPTIDISNQIDRLINLGAEYLHIANTLSVPKGGESGQRLKEFSLETIAKVRIKYPNVKIVGGGGIYSSRDVRLYKKVGANYFSLATIWLKPWKATSLLNEY